ncbi:MAG TPA: MarR family transcriptional regulator [Pseudothermotoga sp.]|uniref:MarR family winged helix-turn-helix transcriptional regulator n=1 Tax=Thermotoga profunda TaxID=1508420 RepID=UPI00059732FA|nr:MarR family transcriptional regulator [Thermotoga profunda]
MNEDYVFKRFLIVQRLHFHLVHEQLEDLGIHPGQPPMLMIIGKNEGITQNQIAEKLNLRPATVAIMLRRMEKAGLIERQQDANDRRLQRVFLTKKGKGSHKFLQEQMQEIEKIAMQGFSEDEKNQLKQFLDRMIVNLKKHLRGDRSV